MKHQIIFSYVLHNLVEIKPDKKCKGLFFQTAVTAVDTIYTFTHFVISTKFILLVLEIKVVI